MTTTEKKAKYTSNYYRANKETILAQAKVRYQNNREEMIAKQLDRHRAQNLPCTIVYVIPNYDGLGNDYVGITKNLNNRLAKHKHLGKLNVDKWDILDIEYDREKARLLEKEFHTKGYHGGRKKRVLTNN
jgi:predicted GIY-YIG superfamily endonuclease